MPIVRGTNRLCLTALLLVHSIALLFPASVKAQLAVGGVYVDAQGMLRQTLTLSDDERLKLLQRNVLEPSVDSGVKPASPLRKISLKRLEQVVGELQKDGKPLSAEIQCLAGVSRVQYVFFVPETNDVIIAGPAEAWKAAPGGEIVGEKSGHAVLHLDDLIAALRFSFANPQRDGFIGCSINPTAEGMKAYSRFVGSIRTIDRSMVDEVATGMEQAMGPQAVSVYGVDGDSRFALVLVAADYRLKRIAMGHDPSPVKKVVSYLDLAANSSSGALRQHRWWFVARYDEIRQTRDELAFEFVGQGLGVQTAAQKSVLNPDREPPPSRSAKQFADQATQNLPALAAKVPVFGELQNLVSLAVAAELIRRQSVGAKSTWKPDHFLNNEACPIARYPVPKQVPSLANLRQVRNRAWMFSVSGGVEISPESLIAAEQTKPGGDTLATTYQKNKSTTATANWWWD